MEDPTTDDELLVAMTVRMSIEICRRLLDEHQNDTTPDSDHSMPDQQPDTGAVTMLHELAIRERSRLADEDQRIREEWHAVRAERHRLVGLDARLKEKEASLEDLDASVYARQVELGEQEDMIKKQWALVHRNRHVDTLDDADLHNKIDKAQDEAREKCAAQAQTQAQAHEEEGACRNIHSAEAQTDAKAQDLHDARQALLVAEAQLLLCSQEVEERAVVLEVRSSCLDVDRARLEDEGSKIQQERKDLDVDRARHEDEGSKIQQERKDLDQEWAELTKAEAHLSRGRVSLEDMASKFDEKMRQAEAHMEQQKARFQAVERALQMALATHQVDVEQANKDLTAREQLVAAEKIRVDKLRDILEQGAARLKAASRSYGSAADQLRNTQQHLDTLLERADAAP